MGTLENGRASRFRAGRQCRDDCLQSVPRYVRVESALSSLAGACLPAAEPRAGPGGLCLFLGGGRLRSSLLLREGLQLDLPVSCDLGGG